MPPRNKRTKKRTKKRGGGNKKNIKKRISGGSRFKTTPIETPQPAAGSLPRESRFITSRVEGSKKPPYTLKGYPQFILEDPHEEVINDDLFERHGRILGKRQVPESLFREISQDPNVESIRKLQREYIDIKKELERLKQKVYLDHEYQFELIMERLG